MRVLSRVQVRPALHLLAIGTIATLICAAAAPGCSQQGEGERCSCKNYNDDCATGLTCVTGKQSQICCPAMGSRTEAGCLQASETCTPESPTGAGGGTSTATGTTTSTGMGGAGGTGGGMGGAGGTGGAGGSGGTGGV